MEATTITSMEQLKDFVGKETSVGPWVEVTQERVDAFADATGDHQWIHVDPDRAKNSPFGGTIQHGYLTLSMSPILRGGSILKMEVASKMGLNYGLNRVRFISPVKVGSRIRMRTKLLNVEEVSPNIWQMVNEQTIDIEGQDKPAMVAEGVTRTYL